MRIQKAVDVAALRFGGVDNWIVPGVVVFFIASAVTGAAVVAAYAIKRIIRRHRQEREPGDPPIWPQWVLVSACLVAIVFGTFAIINLWSGGSV